MKKKVVVDCDDVLLLLNESVEEYLKIRYPDYSMSKIHNFALDGDIGCPKSEVLKAYGNPIVFVHAGLTFKFYDALELLCNKYDVIISTNNLNLSIIKYKIELFQRIFNDLELTYWFSCKKKPVCQEAYAVFEDCLENMLEYSPDSIKVLIDKPYNQESYNGVVIKQLSNLCRCKNFYAGVQYLLGVDSDE